MKYKYLQLHTLFTILKCSPRDICDTNDITRGDYAEFIVIADYHYLHNVRCVRLLQQLFSFIHVIISLLCTILYVNPAKEVLVYSLF